jgi:hypothetical protein
MCEEVVCVQALPAGYIGRLKGIKQTYATRLEICL